MFNDKSRLKILAYLTKFFQKFLTLQAEIKEISAYQIKDIKVVNGSYYIVIQINGTGKLVSYSIGEIAHDDLFLKEFSIKDIRTILQLYYEGFKKSKYILINQKLNNKGSFVFGLKKRSSGEIIQVTAAEISMNKELLKQCAPEDTHRIGFIYASEQLERE